VLRGSCLGSRAERKIKNKMHLQPKKTQQLIYKALETMKNHCVQAVCINIAMVSDIKIAAVELSGRAIQSH